MAWEQSNDQGCFAGNSLKSQQVKDAGLPWRSKVVQDYIL